MKISQNLPQFKNSSALIIVAGWQVATIYHATAGKLEVIEEIEIEKTRYSDKEGFFTARTRNIGQLHTGVPIEEDKRNARKEFLNETSEKTKDIADKKAVKELYIFSPSEGLNSLEESFSPEIKNLIKGRYEGNYLKNKPFDLLKIIQDDKPEPVPLMSEEAKKILKKNK